MDTQKAFRPRSWLRPDGPLRGGLRRAGRAWPWAVILIAVAVVLVPRRPNMEVVLLPALLLALMLVFLLALLSGLLRRRPLLALVLVLLWLPLSVAFAGPNRYSVLVVGTLAVWAAMASLALRLRWTVSLPWTVVAALDVLTVLGFFPVGADPIRQTGPIVLLITLSTWLFANSVGESRRRARQTRRQETEQAIEAERLRIAREMHDLIAHSLGAIAIQAGMGSRVIETQPAEARIALRAIETTSRQTLAELRRTLTALRRSDPEGAPAAPAPGLADLGRLVTIAQDAGVRVEVERLGDVRSLPADLELSAYRIVQESVTNVVRHAGTPRCLVRLGFGAAELVIEVLDGGRGTSEATGSGYGLVGMRERASLLGGRLSAGPRPEGGFQVIARLPVPEEVLSR